MLCDGRPDPISKREINTFINLLRENVDQFDVEKICKQCELIFEVRESCEFFCYISMVIFRPLRLTGEVSNLPMKWF